jgi:hypothetical protein
MREPFLFWPDLAKLGTDTDNKNNKIVWVQFHGTYQGKQEAKTVPANPAYADE